jgi:hypothetical protein
MGVEMGALGRGLLGIAAYAVLASLAVAQTPPPMPAPPPAPVAPQAQYYYNDNGKPSGPITLDELKRKLASGEITPDTLVWAAGMPGWVAAKTIPELTVAQPLPAPSPAPAPSPTPNPSPAPTPAPAAAQGGCSGGRTYFSDDFARSPVDNPVYSVEEGKLKTKAQPGNSQWFIYNRPLRVENYEACVTAQFPNKFQNAADIDGGLIFAGPSIDDFYMLVVSPNGQASIQHLANKKIDSLVEWKDFEAIKIDPPGKNLLRAVVKGNAVTAYINGQKFAEATIGTAPQGPHVGLFFHSEQAQHDTWKFISLKVTDAP